MQVVRVKVQGFTVAGIRAGTLAFAFDCLFGFPIYSSYLLIHVTNPSRGPSFLGLSLEKPVGTYTRCPWYDLGLRIVCLGVSHDSGCRIEGS